MKNIRKPFCKKLFDRYDKRGRDTIKKYIDCRDNENIYDYDLCIDHNFFKGIEVEIIGIWRNDRKMPFFDIPKGNTRLFDRKLKYDDTIIFIQLSNDLTKCCIFNKKMVSLENYYQTSSGNLSYRVNNPICLETKDLTRKHKKIFNVLKLIN